jgi:hypothetical protein
MLAEFLETEDFRSVHYISKNHLGRPEHRDLLFAHEGVLVFDIERNIRDVVVSSYYDKRNRHGYEGSFRHYYWKFGRFVADEVIRYHSIWRDAGPRFCMISYEGLHEDFASEVTRIGSVLGLQLDEPRIQELHDKTSLGTLRKKYKEQPLYEGDRFFRKGVVGDWENHFDPAMVRDMENIERHGIGSLDWRAFVRKAGRTLRVSKA